jgi:hypothetical protein
LKPRPITTAARALAIFLTLWLTIETSPAPIIESPATTPVPAKPKQKPPRVKSQAPSSGAGKFSGTWTATVSTGTEQSTTVTQLTLIIQEKNAALTAVVTNTLTDGEYWSNLPEEYNTVSPFSFKCVWSSTDLTVESANLRIRWPAGQTLDWNPKTMPFSAIQSLAAAAPGMYVLTLHGDQLTREFDRPGSPSFQRLRGSRK